MKKIALIVFMVIITSILSAGAGQTGEYRLGPRDVIAISVWGIDELQFKEIIIRDDGKFDFPLVGELGAAALSPTQLSQLITSKLAEYIRNPRVTVNVVKFRTTRVYVLGEITKPGLYEIDRQHRLLDAIGMAGGFTRDTAKKRVFLIRQGQTTKPLEINLLRLLQMGEMSQNCELGDGDVVFLTKNHRIDFSRDILPLISGAYYISNFGNDE